MDTNEQAREALTRAAQSAGFQYMTAETRAFIDETIYDLSRLSPTTPVDGVGAEPVAVVHRKGNMIGALLWTNAGDAADLPDGTKLYAAPLANPEAEARLRERVAELERRVEFLTENRDHHFSRADKAAKEIERLQEYIAKSQKEVGATIEDMRARDKSVELRKRAEAAEARLAQAERGPAVTEAAKDVLAERRRQVEAEGWTPDHDDTYANGEIAAAATCYAFTAARSPHHIHNQIWPWSSDWWKPAGKRRNLVKAGALILAEIERLDRAALHPQSAAGEEECATDGCENRATVRFERGGVGSHYCGSCYRRVQALQERQP